MCNPRLHIHENKQIRQSGRRRERQSKDGEEVRLEKKVSRERRQECEGRGREVEEEEELSSRGSGTPRQGSTVWARGYSVD